VTLLNAQKSRRKWDAYAGAEAIQDGAHRSARRIVAGRVQLCGRPFLGQSSDGLHAIGDHYRGIAEDRRRILYRQERGGQTVPPARG